MSTLSLVPDATLAQTLQWAQQAGVDRLDAQMLLLHTCQRPLHDRAWLLTHDRTALTHTQRQLFLQFVAQRLDQVPLAYITGAKEFFGLQLHIDARVLDPRPDTEILVEWALTCMQSQAQQQPLAPLVDLGTGSGAIALALQSQYPQWPIWAVDASTDALEVAQHNAQTLGLGVHFLKGNWLGDWHAWVAQTPNAPTLFGLIVSNPPYIAQDDPHVPALHHEPMQALTAGADGLDDIRQIIAQAPQHLLPGGWLLLEHGWNQAQDVQKLLQAQGFRQVQSRKDLAGIDRVSGGQWLGMK